MISEIGSNFWIAPEDIQGQAKLLPPYSFGYGGSDYAWLSTGRSATRFVLKTIEERNPNIIKVALLPPFTCHTVIEPFVEYGYEIHTLPISLDLETTSDEIIRSQEQTNASVLIVHRYYGFDTLPDFYHVVEELRSKGVVIIEDCTQSMYSSFKPSDADYFVGSIRKWCGVPDGGFAICKEGRFIDKPVVEDKAMVETKRMASVLKYRYLFEHEGDKPTFKLKYREGEGLLDGQRGFYRIGDLSVNIQANLNVDDLRHKRKSNYQTLLKGLKSVTSFKILFNDLTEEAVPLYFPILVDDRDSLQELLADNDIYAPVVWPKPDCCPPICKESEEIYEKILCIPVDQRYGTDDMDRIVKVIKDKYEN